LATTYKKLTAYCELCRKEGDPSSLILAPYSVKKREFRNGGSITDPGGADKYLPVCFDHYCSEMSLDT
jgi:thymidine kinase